MRRFHENAHSTCVSWVRSDQFVVCRLVPSEIPLFLKLHHLRVFASIYILSGLSEWPLISDGKPPCLPRSVPLKHHIYRQIGGRREASWMKLPICANKTSESKWRIWVIHPTSSHIAGTDTSMAHRLWLDTVDTNMLVSLSAKKFRRIAVYKADGQWKSPYPRCFDAANILDFLWKISAGQIFYVDI